MSEPSNSWQNWVLAGVPVLLIVFWTIVKKLFTSAVRAEMEQMHYENQERLLSVEKRLSEIEVGVASIEGYIKGVTQKS